jgi:hypothetical protein
LADYKLLELSETFSFIKDQLQAENEAKLQALIKRIQKEGNQPEGQVKIKEFDILRDNLRKNLDFLQQLKDTLSNKKYRINQSVNSGLLRERSEVIASKLADYEKLLAQTSKNLGLSKPNFSAKSQNFLSELGEANIAEALVLIEEKQIDLLKSFRPIYQIIEEKKPREKLLPFVSANRNQVKVGEMYQAEVMLLRFLEVPKSQNMRMKVNGKEIPVSEFGYGEVKFKPQGIGLKTWQGEITVRLRGRDTTFKFEKQYYVLPK